MIPLGILASVPRGVAPPPAYATWDAGVLSPGSILTNPRTLSVATPNGYHNTRAAQPITGDVYFAIRCVRGSAANFGAGVADSGVSLATNAAYVGMGFSLAAWFEGRLYYNGTSAGNISGMASNVDVQIAVRAATRRVWMRVDGGPWFGAGDPAADTSPTRTIGGTGALHVAATLQISSGTALGGSLLMRLLSDPGEVTGTPPAGFIAGLPV